MQLEGAMWATTASYGLGAVASFVLGRRALAMPIPVSVVARAGVAAFAMAVVVERLPAIGGAPELMLKAGVGAVMYGALAAALDVGGLRGKALRAVATLRPRLVA